MKLYSNEIVFRGHPDKVCDQISDALLTEYLKGDENSRCGIETVGGKGKIFITGEVTSTTKVNVKKVAKRVLKDIGYKTNYKIIDNIGKQSPDIARGTNEEVNGAGDNGMMFGYATNETEQMLPKAQVILQEFAEVYDELRKNHPDLKPDGKAQLTGTYDDDMNLQEIITATICYNNTEVNRDNIVKRYVDYIENPLDQNKVKLIRNGKEYEFLKIRKEMAIFNE